MNTLIVVGTTAAYGLSVAATFLPGRLRKSRSKLLERDGDRVVYVSKEPGKPFERVEELLEILDD